jgi:hypothetical protein
VLKRTYGPEVFPYRLRDGTRSFPTFFDKPNLTPPLVAPAPKAIELGDSRPTETPKDYRLDNTKAEPYTPGAVRPPHIAGQPEYVITARLMEAGAGAPKEILGLPRVTVDDGQLAPIHIIDIPQNLLEKTIVEEKIRIGTFLDVRVKRLGGNKVRMFYSLERNQVDQSGVSQIRVLGNSLQGIQELELHTPTKIVFQKDPKGVGQRWIEITVDEQRGPAEQPAPPAPTKTKADNGAEKDARYPDGRSHEFGKVKPDTELKHTFRIVNTSKQPMQLNSIRVSAACVSAALNRKLLEPGEEAKLEITVDARKFNGARTMWAFVDCDERSEVGTLIFTVTANSENSGLDPEDSPGRQ